MTSKYNSEIPDWILKQKKGVSGKTAEIQIDCSSVNSIVPMIFSWFGSLYYGHIKCKH